MLEFSQTMITQAFNKVKKYALTNTKQKDLDRNIVAFIVEELQAFSIIQSRHLRE